MPETTPNASVTTPELPRLALRPKEAAKALGIGERRASASGCCGR